MVGSWCRGKQHAEHSFKIHGWGCQSLQAECGIPDQEAMNALILPLHDKLCKHYAPLCVHCAVGDPVLVRQRGRAVDDELPAAGVPRGCCLHFNRIVACRTLQSATQRP